MPTPELAYLDVAAMVGVATGFIACLYYLTFVEKKTGLWLRFVQTAPSLHDQLFSPESIQPVVDVEIVEDVGVVE